MAPEMILERTDVHSWVSPNTGCEMRAVRYGERGRVVVYFPSSGGDETEFERYDMPAVCASRIAAGTLQVFSVDARGPHGLFSDALPHARRMAEYARFERYAKEELLPWLRQQTGCDGVTALGCSYGAFVVANLLLKVPELVRYGVGFGGVYGLWHRLGGHHDLDVYYHTPLEFLPRWDDPEALARIRETDGFDLFAGRDDPWLESSDAMAEALRERSIPCRYDVWDSPADHHERWWRGQLGAWLERALPLSGDRSPVPE